MDAFKKKPWVCVGLLCDLVLSGTLLWVRECGQGWVTLPDALCECYVSVCVCACECESHCVNVSDKDHGCLCVCVCGVCVL